MIRLRRRRPLSAAFVFHPEYGTRATPPAMDPHRGLKIIADLESSKLLKPTSTHTPYLAPLRWLLEAHTEEYIQSLQSPTSLTGILGSTLNETEADEWIGVQRRMVGGTRLAAALALRTNRPAFHLGGGLHHAESGRGQGFCIFNDLAVTIHRLRRRGFDAPILIIDLDLHDGEGTRQCFAEDPTVHTYSLHNHPLGAQEAIASTSVALGSGFDDQTYLDALKTTLTPLVESVKPGFIFYLAGTDPALDDPLGDAELTGAGLLERDLWVMEQVRRCGNPPLVITLAGGYGNRTWSYTSRFIRHAFNSKPSAKEPSFQRRRSPEQLKALLDQLKPDQLTRETKDSMFEWSLSETDIQEALGSQPTVHRFLGFYSQYGLEFAFEKHGIFKKLRDRGYSSLVLRLDLKDPYSPTLRIFDRTIQKPLIETRMSRRTNVEFNRTALHIEWLLMQRPDRPFSTEQPALPGQSHPGLGMLQEMVLFYELVCLRLNLDLLEFIPSKWHVAEFASQNLAYRDPQTEALRRSISGIASKHGIHTTAWALEDHRIVDREGQPIVWPDTPMVYEVGSARQLDPTFERQVEKALLQRKDKLLELKEN